ncbi:hypothetical protein TRSC58_03869 [Trypanosoma rangeli SC58]|uniref:TET-Associated Glycosyltransferase domain-containing protein n=2 Tax=Trypanosoma rangeli SC58 TaxID=429131 RepID=A0A061IZ41_TRYRA|nr:hypothetical protein TRSC58_03869 [Trypanosoma rangeli SC58]
MRRAKMQSPTLLGESHVGDGVHLEVDSCDNDDFGYAARATGDTTCVDVGNSNTHAAEYFCPVFVPSKSRYHSERGTISLLIRDKVPFTLVVEPEERVQYEQLVDRLLKKWWWGAGDAKEDGAQWLSQRPGIRQMSRLPSQALVSVPPCTPPPPAPLPRRRQRDVTEVRKLVNIQSLPLSDQGVSYVRNYILTELVSRALPTTSSVLLNDRTAQWFWVMDDDIQRFYMAWNGKNSVITPRQLFTEVYSRIQTLHGSACDMNDIAVFSLEYPRFAYKCGDGDLALNSYNNIASLFRYDLVPPDCRYRFRIREDYDYTLQLICHGLKTARFRNLSFEVPGMGEMAGGMTSYYKTQKEDIRLQNKMFVETWPAVAQECIKGKGVLQREDIRVRWDLLHPKKNSNPSATLNCRTPLQTKAHKSLPHNINAAHPKTNEGCGKTVGSAKKGKLKAKRSRSSHATREARKPEEDVEEQTLQRTSMTTTGLTEKNHTERKASKVEIRKPPEWKGYVLERWRCITEHEALGLHLHPIPSERLRLGQTVAVVPPLFHQTPSVVEAVLIDKSIVRKRRVRKTEGPGTTEVKRGSEEDTVVEWSAVARGLPILSVTCCYEVPAVGVSVAAAAVDAFFEREWEKENETVE